MDYPKISRILIYCSVVFVMGCGQSPTEPPESVETVTPAYNTTETVTQATWEEEHSLPNNWDGGLFSETPCQAPCFAGITPGMTAETQIMTLIQDHDYFQNCSLEDRPNQGRWVSCNGLIININKTNSTVDGLGFKTSQQFSLEDVVSKYGEATMTSVVPIGIPEAPEITMVVFWEEKKIRMNLEDQEGVVYQLSPSAVVTNIVYYNEENDGFTIFLQPWHGYGEYVVDGDWK